MLRPRLIKRGLYTCPGTRHIMLQKIILAIVVFIVILLALTFGEVIAHDVFAWLSYLTGLVIHNFSYIYYALKAYLSAHLTKDRKSDVLGQSVSVRLDHGGSRIIKQKRKRTKK